MALGIHVLCFIHCLFVNYLSCIIVHICIFLNPCWYLCDSDKQAELLYIGICIDRLMQWHTTDPNP